MTAPRQVLPGTTYLVTRRCFQRQFLLRPSRSTNGIFLFVLAVAVQRFGIRIHAFCVLANHFHLVLTDQQGQLPAFEQYLDSLVARAVNSSLGRWESFWAPSSYSAVALLTPQDIVDKAAYTLANPVAAGLVTEGRDWPGLWSDPAKIEMGTINVKRPEGFFRPTGPMPEEAELELSCPPGFESAAAFREQLTHGLEFLQRKAAEDIEANGRKFLGARSVLAQDPQATPASIESRRELRPRIATKDKWKRIEALLRLKKFLVAYREAWIDFRDGIRDALFPSGTYLLRVRHRVCCAVPG